MIRRPALLWDTEALLSASTPYYVRFPADAELVMSIQIQHHDATSAYAATLYSSNVENPAVPATTAAGPDLEIWSSEAADAPIPTVSASAAGSKVIHLGNQGAKWLLLKIEPSANCSMSIILHGRK